MKGNTFPSSPFSDQIFLYFIVEMLQSKLVALSLAREVILELGTSPQISVWTSGI